jgi:hypothetical protein
VSHAAYRLFRVSVNEEMQLGSEANGPQHPEGVLLEAACWRPNSPYQLVLYVNFASLWVMKCARMKVAREGVYCEVAMCQVGVECSLYLGGIGQIVLSAESSYLNRRA